MNTEEQANIDLVKKIFCMFKSKYNWSGYPEKDDMIQIGYMALIGCQKRFNPKICGFETYASKRIYGAMLDAYRRKDLCRCNRDAGWEANYYFQSDMPSEIPYTHKFPADSEIDLSFLDKKSRLILHDYYFNSMDLKAIAAKYKVSTVTIWQYKKQALGKLKAKLIQEVAK